MPGGPMAVRWAGLCVAVEAVLAADPHLAGAALVLQGPGALVGRSLGLFFFGRVVGVDATIFDGPAIVVASHGQDLAIAGGADGHGRRSFLGAPRKTP